VTELQKKYKYSGDDTPCPLSLGQHFRGLQYFKLRGQAAQEKYFGLFNPNDEDLTLLKKAGRCL